MPFVEFFSLVEVTPPPAVAAWTARMLERPSAQATKPMM
jgi:glutathione S-transferase